MKRPTGGFLLCVFRHVHRHRGEGKAAALGTDQIENLQVQTIFDLEKLPQRDP